MSTAVEVGSIIEGKVTSIKPFGAFVAINESQQGLVHISHVAHSFVKEVSDHLKVGDEIKVKVLSVDAATGKISLSIKEAAPKPEGMDQRPARTGNRDFNKGPRDGGRGGNRGNTRSFGDGKERFNTFEDQLKKWMKHSEENLAALNKKNNK